MVYSNHVATDALEGIGHACGHNLIMTASVAGSIATAEMVARHGLGGKVVVFGTPAEEGASARWPSARCRSHLPDHVELTCL